MVAKKKVYEHSMAVGIEQRVAVRQQLDGIM
jgi:hypothetical protein